MHTHIQTHTHTHKRIYTHAYTHARKDIGTRAHTQKHTKAALRNDDLRGRHATVWLVGSVVTVPLYRSLVAAAIASRRTRPVAEAGRASTVIAFHLKLFYTYGGVGSSGSTTVRRPPGFAVGAVESVDRVDLIEAL